MFINLLPTSSFSDKNRSFLASAKNSLHTLSEPSRPKAGARLALVTVTFLLESEDYAQVWRGCRHGL